jgi:hypothetical protein
MVGGGAPLSLLPSSPFLNTQYPCVYFYIFHKKQKGKGRLHLTSPMEKRGTGRQASQFTGVLVWLWGGIHSFIQPKAWRKANLIKKVSVSGGGKWDRSGHLFVSVNIFI